MLQEGSPFLRIPHLAGERTVLRKLAEKDAEGLRELTNSPSVYRYLPTFLFERKYPDPAEVIRRLYTECLRDSLILGIFDRESGAFCGLAEFYGYRSEIRKISVGYRLPERCWGRGIATEALGLMIRWLEEDTDIEIITASTMVENAASANVLKKNGFTLVIHDAEEDWGYGCPTAADKWIR